MDNVDDPDLWDPRWSLLPKEAKRITQTRWPVVQGTAGCQVWMGRVDADGYGVVSAHGQTVGAHRVALVAALNRDIGAGMTVGHACHDAALSVGECIGGRCLHRRCVNPNHLLEQSRSTNSSLANHSRPDVDEPGGDLQRPWYSRTPEYWEI